jgi:hypothetical protein
MTPASTKRYLENVAGPVPLVLDVRIVHDRFGSSSDPSLNGNLHYPNDIDRSLNEATTDKIRKYRGDYNNNPPSAVSFIPAIASTSGRLHIEFIRLLFLHDHRETDHFFAASGVPVSQSTSRGFFRTKIPDPPIHFSGPTNFLGPKIDFTNHQF